MKMVPTLLIERWRNKQVSDGRCTKKEPSLLITFSAMAIPTAISQLAENMILNWRILCNYAQTAAVVLFFFYFTHDTKTYLVRELISQKKTVSYFHTICQTYLYIVFNQTL